jgi:uncharacterized protein (DUF58 family)
MNNIKKLILKAKRGFFGDKLGNNISTFRGQGGDFIELREYYSGDDIRKIDWNITAKQNRPFVKIFREERELNVVVSTILSGSTFFGSVKLKRDLIAEIVAILGFSAIKNGDPFSSHIFANFEHIFRKPSKKSFGIEKDILNITNFDSIGKNVQTAFIEDKLLKTVKRRSLVFLISDFYSPIELKYLSKHSDIIAVIIRDKLEENPPEFGQITLIDGTTGNRNEGIFKNWGGYSSKLKEHDLKLINDFNKFGVRFVKIYTDQNPIIELKKLFNR